MVFMWNIFKNLIKILTAPYLIYVILNSASAVNNMKLIYKNSTIWETLFYFILMKVHFFG
jgi:hypothetical protein